MTGAAMTRTLTAVLLSGLLAGCAEVYSKPGATTAQFYRDDYECEVGIPSSTPAMVYAPSAHPNPAVNLQMQGQALQNSAAVWAAAGRSASLYRRCMAGRGWTKQ